MFSNAAEQKQIVCGNGGLKGRAELFDVFVELALGDGVGVYDAGLAVVVLRLRVLQRQRPVPQQPSAN